MEKYRKKKMQYVVFVTGTSEMTLGKLSPLRELSLCWAAARQPIIV